MEQQATLAKTHGITAFCYWHYWFAGRRILETPLEKMLADGRPRMKYCLAWANESWTGSWVGRPHDILIEQTYPGPEDHIRHFELLNRFFSDPRYLKVDGRPIVVLYRPDSIPDLAGFVRLWRDLAQRFGLPGIFLIGRVRSHAAGWDVSLLDSVVPVRIETRSSLIGFLTGTLRRFGLGPQIIPYQKAQPLTPRTVFDSARWHPTVFPNWDDTPRKGRRGTVLARSSPQLFQERVRVAAKIADAAEPKLLFIKSWNEWAEGNYLEPDVHHGRGYLEALREGLGAAPGVA